MHHADEYGQVASSTGYGASNVDVRKAIRICWRYSFLVVLMLAQCRILADKRHSCLDTKEKIKAEAPTASGATQTWTKETHDVQLEQSGKSEKQTQGQNPLTIIYTGNITRSTSVCKTHSQHKIIYTVPP
jgi:hypothetical protein